MIADCLQGRRILVTRSAEQSGTLTDGLRELGATVLELPMVEIVPPDSYEPFDSSLKNLYSYQWLILTSTNAVQALASRLQALNLSPDILRQVKVGAVGSATERAIVQLGVQPDIVPKKYVAEALAELLRDKVSGCRVLIARAAVARDVIPDQLAKHGAEVSIVEAYQTVRPAHTAQKLVALLSEGIDAVPFLSSSAVKNFMSFLEEAKAACPPDGVKSISIGPITSATLREFRWEPAIEAEPSDLGGVIDAAKKLFS